MDDRMEEHVGMDQALTRLRAAVACPKDHRRADELERLNHPLHAEQ